jgi:multiple sugar transport system substrate-binding protein
MSGLAAKHHRRHVLGRGAVMAGAAGPLLTLAACGPGGGSAAPAGRPAATIEGEIRVAMYNFQPWIEAMNATFAAFQQAHPRARVTLEITPSGIVEALQAAAMAGTPVDVSVAEASWIQRFGEAGQLVELEPLLKRDRMALDLWYEPALQEGRYDARTGISGSGALYALPATYVGTLAYYNKALFQAAGLKEPAESWTWDDLVQLGTRLTTRGSDPGAAQYGVLLGGRIREAMIWGAGGEFVARDGSKCLLDTPAAVKGIAFQVDLMHKHKVVPTGEALTALPAPPFANGRIGIAFDGSWNLDTYVKQLTFEWDIAPVPIGPTGKRVAYMGTNLLVLWKGGKGGDAAWELLKFMTTEPGMKYFAETGTPGYKRTAESELYLKPGGKPAHRKYAVELARYGRPYTTEPFLAYWDPEYVRIWSELVANTLSPEAGARQMCEQIDRALQEQRGRRGSGR